MSRNKDKLVRVETKVRKICCSLFSADNMIINTRISASEALKNLCTYIYNPFCFSSAWKGFNFNSFDHFFTYQLSLKKLCHQDKRYASDFCLNWRMFVFFFPFHQRLIKVWSLRPLRFEQPTDAAVYLLFHKMLLHTKRLWVNASVFKSYKH